MLQKDLPQIAESDPGIEDVFNNNDMLAFDRFVKVLEQLDRPAGGARTPFVARNRHKIEGAVDVHAARQVGQENRRAFQNADHDDRLPSIVAGDGLAQFGDTFPYLLAAVEDEKLLTCRDVHLHPEYLQTAQRRGFIKIRRYTE